MPRQVFFYDPPERFVAGAVGQPGERTFFLQARGSGRMTSVALEKFQVASLAQRIEELLDEVLRRSEGSAVVPAVAPADLKDNEPLDQPILEEFRVGTMALAWDPEDERVVIEAQAATEEAEEGQEEEEFEPFTDEVTEGPDVLRVSITPGEARAFAQRALKIVAAGRPPCPFCGQPLDPDGHICPRQNGQRRSTLVT
ncbi:MAG: DUF3090 family protein [Streptosporangiales bacterium]|nr:DUF3090 family protein [Streptosporangiales bacterium]